MVTRSKRNSYRYKKGGRVSQSGTYFGGKVGPYFENPNVGLESHAYGSVNAVSHGVINTGSTGPNLHVMPNSSMIKTGGYRKKRRTNKRRIKKRQSTKKRTMKRRTRK